MFFVANLISGHPATAYYVSPFHVPSGSAAA